MVLHSDGVVSRWRWEDFPELGKLPAAVTARKLVHQFGRETDDVTAIVVKAKAS
jgi:hypothetical protein